MEAIKKAIDALGGQRPLAAAIGVTPGAVNHWATGLKQVPAARCIAIERACHSVVTRYDLRPDIFIDPDYGKTIEGEVA